METQLGRPTEAVVPQRAFEALLADLDVTPALVQALRAAGYELERPRPDYPVKTWHAANQAVRAHLFPHLSEAAGLRALGRRSTRGFQLTAVGAALGPSIDALAPERLLARLPRLMAVVRPDLQAELRYLGERHYRLEVYDQVMLPDLLAGSLELWFEQHGLAARLETEQAGPAAFSVVIRW